MSGTFRQIWIDGSKVAIVDLDIVMEEVRKSGLVNDTDIKTELLTRVKKDNYVPASASDLYAEALLKEYKRFSGEDVPEEREGVEIEILGAGCIRCEGLLNRVFEAVERLGLPADVQHVKDIKQIAMYGPVVTPAIAVNGKIVLMNKEPSVEELCELFEEKI